MPEEKIQKIEKHIYDIADLVFILRTHCEYNSRHYEGMEYINTMLTKISGRVDRISAML
jgi:hypothetical protein